MKSQHIHICKIMELVSIFRKNKMKKAPLLKNQPKAVYSKEN